MTGQVAALANPGEGLVVGDRVNTASRAQSAAEPGTLAVDDVTHEVTSAAIAYEDAGDHAVKGKAEPIHLWRAVRVIAGVGGAGREPGIEAPLIGRDADLRLLKELFHGALERRAARLVSVYGAAGVGKTRLSWEFDKYADGLAEGLLWHSGRCLSYGDGVAYWALAEMIRQRFGIPEDAPLEETRAKLDAGLERWVPDPADRDFLWPRLGVLLGVAEPGLGRTELFAGWRLFLERLADHLPVVLVFDDLQWADEGMLDFIEHVLEWSAESPIFMLTLARPELASGREGWPGGRRGATVLQLEPLDSETMGELLDELVEGLPRRVRARVIDRAEGVPLYAIETIRALANRGVLEQREGRLTLIGELGELDVPASLGSLLAARLDALEPLERRFVKAMAVFGTSFSRASAAELGDVPEELLEAILESLVRKQVLAIRADPFSPDSGQYVFVQGLLRTVAYEMLSRRERKPRHLAAAAHLRQLFPHDGEDVAAEAIASHYLEAYRASGQRDEDAEELRATTVSALRRGARRAASVGAPESAERAYLTAIELARDEQERTELTAAAGEMAMRAGRFDEAIKLLKEAGAGYLAAGREREAASMAGHIGRSLSYVGRNDQAIEQLTGALRILGPEHVDSEVARLHAVLGHAFLYRGEDEQAAASLETALRFAQELALPEVQSGALIDKGIMCLQDNRPDEARALLGAALEIAERHELIERAHNALGNSGMLGMQWDQPGADQQFARALALARRLGDRFRESISAGNLMFLYVLAGRWNEDPEDGPGPAGRTRRPPGGGVRALATGRHAHAPGRAPGGRRRPRRDGRLGAQRRRRPRLHPHLGGDQPGAHRRAPASRRWSSACGCCRPPPPRSAPHTTRSVTGGPSRWRRQSSSAARRTPEACWPCSRSSPRATCHRSCGPRSAADTGSWRQRPGTMPPPRRNCSAQSNPSRRCPIPIGWPAPRRTWPHACWARSARPRRRSCWGRRPPRSRRSAPSRRSPVPAGWAPPAQPRRCSAATGASAGDSTDTAGVSDANVTGRPEEASRGDAVGRPAGDRGDGSGRR